MNRLVVLVLLCVPAYLWLVRRLRYRRCQQAEARLTSDLGGSYKRMTVDQAHSIFLYLSELEFPAIFLNATSFALFKTYGIPSISKLLVETGQMAHPTLTSKRAADTGTILLEIFYNSPGDRRSARAIARMNYLHGHYQKAGKISDTDMLYTLCLFALEPGRWVKEYEWRSLTDIELCALGTFWKNVGDAMSIPMHPLLGQDESGFPDGLEWYLKAQDWAASYEIQNMKLAPTNKPLADATLGYFLWFLPASLKPYGISVISCLLEKRLRDALGYGDPPLALDKPMKAMLWTRKMVLRYLCLPRPSFWPSTVRPEMDDQTGRIHMSTYLHHPWYVRPTWMRRWGPEGWLVWALGGALPGDAEKQYRPDGFDVAESGPKAFRPSTVAKIYESSEKILEIRGPGCPFALATP